MKVLVTGAGGFLGRYVVDEALRRGHGVRALVRSMDAVKQAGWDADPRVEVAVVDLRSRQELRRVMAGDAVLHLAADKDSDIYGQYSSTVGGTENLLWAMGHADIRRIVHVSSLAVYDYMALGSGASLDETSPLERDAFDRDAYTQTKLVQERLVREQASQYGLSWTVLRPGMIIGPGNLWAARLGTQGTRVWVCIGRRGRLPITYVENVAEAVVLAAERAAAGEILNVIDDEMPTRQHYTNLLRARTMPRPTVLPIPWVALRGAARVASATNDLLFHKRARLPGLLVPCQVHARFKPLQFSNRKIKDRLGWTPRYTLTQAIDRSVWASPEGAFAAGDRGHAAGSALRIAYMTGQYPRITDTFIQREVAALRQHGAHVETLSVRRPAVEERIPDAACPERDGTHYLVPAPPLHVAATHLALLARTPRRYVAAMATARATCPPGVKALARQVAYFLEAGLVARRMRTNHLMHLHNHFSNSSCSVAMLASVLGGFTYSFTVHGPAELQDPTYWRLDEKIRRAGFVACISHYVRQQAMRFTPPAHWDKLQVVHCGVDPEEFTPVRHTGRGFRLLFVGRLVAAKGVPVLLESVARLAAGRPDVELVVVGDGPERATLEAQTKRLGLAPRVHFRGSQSPAHVRDLLRHTDVFAMASFAEGIPVVLMEAMAAGVPVVATRITGIPELVEDGISGFLVPPGEPQTLADTIARLLDDADLRNQFAAAGREKVMSEFNIAIEVERLSDALKVAMEAG